MDLIFKVLSIVIDIKIRIEMYVLSHVFHMSFYPDKIRKRYDSFCCKSPEKKTLSTEKSLRKPG